MTHGNLQVNIFIKTQGDTFQFIGSLGRPKVPRLNIVHIGRLVGWPIYLST
jgi:hypothetical protein